MIDPNRRPMLFTSWRRVDEREKSSKRETGPTPRVPTIVLNSTTGSRPASGHADETVYRSAPFLNGQKEVSVEAEEVVTRVAGPAQLLSDCSEAAGKG